MDQYQNPHSINRSRPSRRQFLKTVVASTAGLGLASGIPAAVYQCASQSNDVIGVGVIGLGNICRGHIKFYQSIPEQARIVAVCDIYQPRLDWGVEETGARGYHDYQDLLADDQVDVVIICTPDHWHAQMAIDAMQAGKDVDVEKPMSKTIAEARRMVDVAAATGRVLAIDSEHTAHGIWAPARTAIRTGVLGNLLWSQTSRSRNTGRDVPWNYTIDADANPANLDWDRFLGPAPSVPFSRERYFRWRRYWDYSGGIATDLYVHHIAPLIKVTGPEFPVRVTAGGGHFQFSSDALEVPDTFMMTLHFESDHTMMVGGSLANTAELPIVVRGHEANIYFHGRDQRRPAFLHLAPEPPYEESFRDKITASGLEGEWQELPSDETHDDFRTVYRIDVRETETFRENFLRCVRERTTPVLDGRLGYMAQVAVSLGVDAYRQDRVMHFDPGNQTVV